MKQHGNDRVSSHRQGATLVDVVVVFATGVAGVAMAAPALSRARQDSRVAACATNLQTLNAALGALQQDHPGFYAPLYDDSSVTHNVGHFGRLATWIDVLQQRGYIASRSPGYCPADQLPDPLNRQRGTQWALKYPVALGGGYGADHSYAVAVPYSSAAEPATFPCWDPNGEPDRRVLVADGLWTWIHGLGAQGLVTNRALDPWWGSNTVAYRHKFAANLLHRDGHVALVAYDVDGTDYAPACGQTGGVDTTRHFVWRRGEHTEVGFGSTFNNCNDPPPGCTQYPIGAGSVPNEINPAWYTDRHMWTIPDIKTFKGWALN